MFITLFYVIYCMTLNLGINSLLLRLVAIGHFFLRLVAHALLSRQEGRWGLTGSNQTQLTVGVAPPVITNHIRDGGHDRCDTLSTYSSRLSSSMQVRITYSVFGSLLAALQGFDGNFVSYKFVTTTNTIFTVHLGLQESLAHTLVTLDSK